MRPCRTAQGVPRAVHLLPYAPQDPLDEELNMMASPERVVAVLRAELRKVG